jgi:hypothetical protein
VLQREKTNLPAEKLKEIHRKRLEKGSKKGQEKVNCETPRRGSLFPPFLVPFSTLFLYSCSLAPIVSQRLHTPSDDQKRLG